MLTAQWKLGKLSAATWDLQKIFWTQLLQGQRTFLQGLQNLPLTLLGFSRCFYRLKKAMPIKDLASRGGCKSWAVLLQSSGTLGLRAFLAPPGFLTRHAIQMDGHKDRPADKPSCVRTTLARCMQTKVHTDSLRIKQTYKAIFLHTCKLTFIHTYIQAYIKPNKERNKHTCIHTYWQTYICTYIRTYIHTYIHTCMRTLHTAHPVFNIPHIPLKPALHSIHEFSCPFSMFNPGFNLEVVVL